MRGQHTAHRAKDPFLALNHLHRATLGMSDLLGALGDHLQGRLLILTGACDIVLDRHDHRQSLGFRTVLTSALSFHVPERVASNSLLHDPIDDTQQNVQRCATQEIPSVRFVAEFQ